MRKKNAKIFQYGRIARTARIRNIFLNPTETFIFRRERKFNRCSSRDTNRKKKSLAQEVRQKSDISEHRSKG